jgi:hypothetical protein
MEARIRDIRARRRCRAALVRGALAASLAAAPLSALAHGPIFSFSPHTEFKGALEYHLGYQRTEAGGAASNEYTGEFKYGVNSNWTVGMDLPYETGEHRGVGDFGLKTKYRFWRRAGPGAMRSLTALGTVYFDTGAAGVGTGSTDYLGALAYGYESIKWYRWASVGYRINTSGDAGLRRGNRWFLNLVGGWRPGTPIYTMPDTVFVVGLNAEITDRSRLNGVDLPDTGGTELFVSPGMIWTYGHFNLRPGVQIPVYSALNGHRPATDFRFRIELEMHY